MITHTSKFRVRYAETDAQAVAHHSNYVVWMEMARADMLRELGMSYNAIHELGFAIVVTHLEVDYKQPAFFDDELTSTVTVEQLKRVSFLLSYRLLRGDTELAVARSEHATISMQTNRPTRLPGELIQLLESQHSKEG